MEELNTPQIKQIIEELDNDERYLHDFFTQVELTQKGSGYLSSALNRLMNDLQDVEEALANMMLQKEPEILPRDPGTEMPGLDNNLSPLF